MKVLLTALFVLLMTSCGPDITYKNTIEVRYEDGKLDTITDIGEPEDYYIKMKFEDHNPNYLTKGLGREAVALYVVRFRILESEQMIR